MTPTVKPISIIPTERQMSLVRFSPDGRMLYAAGRDSRIHRWDVSQPIDAAPAGAQPGATNNEPNSKGPRYAELAPLAGHDGWVSAIAMHPQQPVIFSSDTWGRLIAWKLDIEPPSILWNHPQAHSSWIRQITLSPDGERLATCGMDKQIRLWSSRDGKLEREWPLASDDIFSIAFHPDGKAIVAGDLKGIVRHWNLADGSLVREFDAKSLYLLSYIQDVGGVRVLAFTPDGKSLAVAGAQPANGGFVEAMPTLKLFDWSTGAETQSIKLGEKTEGFVHDLAFHPEGFWMGVTSGQPGRGGVFFLRPGEPQPFYTQALPNCHSIALAAAPKQLAVLANAGTYGQMKSMARQGIYPGNSSPIHLLEIGSTT